MDVSQPAPIPLRHAWWFVLAAVLCFTAAFSLGEFVVPQLLTIGYVACLIQLARLRTTRGAFYLGLLTAFLCFAPQLQFFWTIFGPMAAILWLILALWIALFAALAQCSLARFGPRWAAALIPFLWTGLEYARSELYYLKFSWLSPAFALVGWEKTILPIVGTYGVGFIAAAFAAGWLLLRRKIVVAAGALLLLAVAKFMAPRAAIPTTAPDLHIGGVQMEFPVESEVLTALDHLVAAHPDVDLVVLSEYTWNGPPPSFLKEWCRKNHRYLIFGGKDLVGGGNFFDTAFVIDSAGIVVFRQGKSVPIPFFNDGLPAPSQAVWNSPWGKIGLCICYDLSYTPVTDELIRHGAQMLIVPAMDVTEWGAQEHAWNARVVPLRAAEYQVPIFRVASSGISEAADAQGTLISQAPFPGQGAVLFAGFHLPSKGSLPWDRWLAPFSTLVAALTLLTHLLWKLIRR